jgi:hypothetical protein
MRGGWSVAIQVSGVLRGGRAYRLERRSLARKRRSSVSAKSTWAESHGISVSRDSSRVSRTWVHAEILSERQGRFPQGVGFGASRFGDPEVRGHLLFGRLSCRDVAQRDEVAMGQVIGLGISPTCAASTSCPLRRNLRCW